MLLASPLKRELTYQGLKLADPNPKQTVEKVRSFYLAQCPDLATAALTGPEAAGEKLRYSFVRANKRLIRFFLRPVQRGESDFPGAGHIPAEAESQLGAVSYVLRGCGALEGLDRLHSPHGATVVC